MASPADEAEEAQVRQLLAGETAILDEVPIGNSIPKRGTNMSHFPISGSIVNGELTLFLGGKRHRWACTLDRISVLPQHKGLFDTFTTARARSTLFKAIITGYTKSEFPVGFEQLPENIKNSICLVRMREAIGRYGSERLRSLDPNAGIDAVAAGAVPTSSLKRRFPGIPDKEFVGTSDIGASDTGASNTGASDISASVRGEDDGEDGGRNTTTSTGSARNAQPTNFSEHDRPQPTQDNSDLSDEFVGASATDAVIGGNRSENDAAHADSRGNEAGGSTPASVVGTVISRDDAEDTAINANAPEAIGKGSSRLPQPTDTSEANNTRPSSNKSGHGNEIVEQSSNDQHDCKRQKLGKVQTDGPYFAGKDREQLIIGDTQFIRSPQSVFSDGWVHMLDGGHSIKAECGRKVYGAKFIYKTAAPLRINGREVQHCRNFFPSSKGGWVMPAKPLNIEGVEYQLIDIYWEADV